MLERKEKRLRRKKSVIYRFTLFIVLSVVEILSTIHHQCLNSICFSRDHLRSTIVADHLWYCTEL